MDFLGDVRRKLDIPPAEREQVMKELEDRYTELREELQTDGMNECEAATEAARRLGKPEHIASEIQTLHRSGWKTAILTAAPLLFATIILAAPPLFRIAPNHLALFNMIANVALLIPTMYLSLREWSAGRRPIWLATWLATALPALVRVAQLPIVYSFATTVNSHSQMGPMSRITTAEKALIWGIAALILLKDYPKWRAWIVLMTLAVAGLSVFCEGWNLRLIEENRPLLTIYLDRMLSQLLFMPIPIVMAIGLFSKHRLGNTASASLFIFSLLIQQASSIWQNNVHILIPIAIYACTVVLFARQKTAGKKLLSLAVGLLAVSLFFLVINQGVIPDLAVSELLSLLGQLIVVLVIPLLFSSRPSSQKPKLAS